MWGESFFATLATVLPVLLLALVADRERPEPESSLDRVMETVTWASLMVGTVCCFAALAGALRPSVAGPAAGSAGLLGALFLWGVLIARRVEPGRPRWESWAHIATALLVTLGLVVAGFLAVL